MNGSVLSTEMINGRLANALIPCHRRGLTCVAAVAGEALLTHAPLPVLRGLAPAVQAAAEPAGRRRLAPQVAQRAAVPGPALAAIRVRVQRHARAVDAPEGGGEPALAPTPPAHSTRSSDRPLTCCCDTG